jgi:hypothetical protein
LAGNFHGAAVVETGRLRFAQSARSSVTRRGRGHMGPCGLLRCLWEPYYLEVGPFWGPPSAPPAGRGMARCLEVHPASRRDPDRGNRARAAHRSAQLLSCDLIWVTPPQWRLTLTGPPLGLCQADCDVLCEDVFCRGI